MNDPKCHVLNGKVKILIKGERTISICIPYHGRVHRVFLSPITHWRYQRGEGSVTMNLILIMKKISSPSS